MENIAWMAWTLPTAIFFVLLALTLAVMTWLAVLATDLSQLFWLRLLAGIGIGGLLPNAISLTAEFAPRRYRATLIILMFSGVSFGGL